MSVECPVNGCPATIPIENDLQIGANITCTECNRRLLVRSLDPPILVPLAPDRDDDPRGELAADHGGTYTLQELIADIIDNSIDATEDGGTVNVEVDFEVADYSEEKKEWPGMEGTNRPYVIIADDAKGMNREILKKAMGKGNRRDYDPWELGHYGVGLKKSALSHCYEITVFSKEKGGQIESMRYSSCYIQKFNHDGIMHKEDIDTHFPWMLETTASGESETLWEKAENILNDSDSGTVVLLEGLPWLLDTTKTYHNRDDIYAALDSHIDETAASLSLVFGKYLSEQGATITYRDADGDEEKSVTKKINIEVDGEELEPLDPFHTDLIDENNNFGTLCKPHTVKTQIREENYDIDINIYIIPNNQHPDYRGVVGDTLEQLKLTRKDASPESLQGCYIYRNQRLVDYGKGNRWKGAYENNSNPKHTAYRWEVHLPTHPDLGDIEHSDWQIDTSKSEATPNPAIRARFQKLAEKGSSQVWHKNDPEYPMAAGPRANRRRGKTGNGTVTKDWERWSQGACTLCTDITEGWKHKKAKHECSYCGKKGHEGPLTDKGKSTGCSVIVPRPERPSKPTKDGSDGETEGVGKETDGDSGSTEEYTTLVVSVVSDTQKPIEVKEEEGKLMIRVNREHDEFDSLMGQLQPIVQKWESEQSSEEEE